MAGLRPAPILSLSAASTLGVPRQPAVDNGLVIREAGRVIEFRASANDFESAASGTAWLWWCDMTLAARWRGW